MKYYERLNNQTARDWPIMPAADADDEISRLRAHVSQLRAENKELRSMNLSLRQVIDEQRLVIRVAAMWGKI